MCIYGDYVLLLYIESVLVHRPLQTNVRMVHPTATEPNQRTGGLLSLFCFMGTVLLINERKKAQENELRLLLVGIKKEYRYILQDRKEFIHTPQNLQRSNGQVIQNPI